MNDPRSHHHTGGKAQDVEMAETTAGESGDKVPAKSSSAATAKSNSTSAKSDSATFAKPAPQAKPMAKLTAMAPRSMQPRSTIQAGKALRARPPRSAGTGTPIGAFKAASTTSTGSSSSGAGETAATGVDGVSGEGAEAAAAPVAPKSNAEFRALMLSGGLKKSRQ